MASIAGGWGVWGCLAVASWCGKTDGEGTDSRGCCTMASIAGMLMPMWGCLTVGLGVGVARQLSRLLLCCNARSV